MVFCCWWCFVVGGVLLSCLAYVFFFLFGVVVLAYWTHTPPVHPYPLIPTPTPLSPLQTAESFNQQAAGHDALIDPDEADQASTRNLMAAVSSLPELTEKKRIMDKHTELATALLGVRGVGVRGWV